MAISDTFLADRITATEAQIVAYETAILAFANNGAIQTYKLDTGQTVQTVTRSDLEDLNKTLDILYNRYSTLCARRDGAASIGRPAW